MTRGWPSVRRRTGTSALRGGLGADSRPPWWPRRRTDGSALLEWARPNVVELAGPASCGKLSLALLWLAEAWEGGLIAVVDESGSFFPPSAAACGLDLERLVVVRPPGPQMAIEAAALLLGSEGFDSVLWLVGSKTRLNGVTGAKLAHLASRSGTTLLAVVPSRESRVPSGRPKDPGPRTRDSGLVSDVRLSIVKWAWFWTDGVLGGVRLVARTSRMRGHAPDQDWELVLARSVSGGSDDDDGSTNRLRLDSAVSVGGGGARAPRARGAPGGDLPAERALAGAG